MKSLGSAYVNLLKTSIGSGVLNFPFLFKTYGIAVTVLLTIVSGFFAATGLLLLCICSQDIGRTADLSKLATLAVPYTRFFVDFSVFVKCFGVATSYMIITKQLLPSFLETVLGKKTFLSSPVFCLLIFLCVIGPFCYLEKMDKLKYTSFLGLVSILFVVVASVWRLLYGKNDMTKIEYLGTPISIFWLSGFGKFVFSFTCHQNIFAVYSELEDNSLPRMKKLIYMIASSCLVLYMSFGLSNYLIYGANAADNVLSNYPEDILTTVVYGFYIIVMGVSYPLQLGPGKTYFMNMVNITPKNTGYRFFNFLLTSVLILATYLIAVSDVGLSLVYSIVGATASTFMCLVLPALYYFNLDVERTIPLTIIAYCAFLFGIFVFTTTLISILLDIHK